MGLSRRRFLQAALRLRSIEDATFAPPRSRPWICDTTNGSTAENGSSTGSTWSCATVRRSGSPLPVPEVFSTFLSLWSFCF